MKAWLPGLLLLLAAVPLHAQGSFDASSFDVSGFALLRGSTAASTSALDDDSLNAQLQLGIDWRPSPRLGAHLHLAARNDDDGSRRGRVGVVQAYLDQTFENERGRLRLTEGAFFLPTSRENVDALWESPYTITSSALNSWFGEEFRPVGLDAQYTRRRRWTAGLTVYGGNDTFGALPPVRGWRLTDRWTLLGEHLVVDGIDYTSVSAETDHDLGYAARLKWNSDSATLQVTHLDNRSDALQHGELLNWETPFTIVGGDLTRGAWTFAGEIGWGKTTVIVDGVSYPSDISAGYALASRTVGAGRATLRVDRYSVDAVHRNALTAAYLWTARPRLRAGLEAIVLHGDRRLTAELRYSFAN